MTEAEWLASPDPVAARQAETTAQAELLREVLGNPFRQVASHGLHSGRSAAPTTVHALWLVILRAMKRSRSDPGTKNDTSA